MADTKFRKPLARQSIEIDLRVAHRCLGLGTVTQVDQQTLLSKDKKVTLIRIKFDIGQSCKFPFRTDAVSSSFFID